MVKNSRTRGRTVPDKEVGDVCKIQNVETRQKRSRSVLRYLTYPGKNSPDRQVKKSKMNDNNDKLRVQSSAKRRIVFESKDEDSDEITFLHASPAAAKGNATSLLRPDPEMNWIGGVERKLLNKYRPQCGGGKVSNIGGQSSVNAKAKGQKGQTGCQGTVDHVTGNAPDKQASQNVHDGIHIFVESDELDYIDDVPNPQDPDNGRLIDPVTMEHVLDDSDEMEKGASASNIIELPKSGMTKRE